jgi:hypothetical protein
MTTQFEIAAKNHRRAVRFFWCLLIGATTVSLVGNIAHAVLPYLPHVVIQIGAAAVPPIALLAAVHGIALAVRAGASGKVYCWAVSAVGAIGAGAFAVSFSGAARSYDRHRVRRRNRIGFPGNHRRGSGRQHPDAGCARRQTGTPHPHRDRARQYANSNRATVGATSVAQCNSPGHAGCTDRCAGTRNATNAGTGFCCGTNRPGTDSAVNANYGDTGRYRPCVGTGRYRPGVGTDCIGHHYSARRDGGRSAGCTP